MILDDLISIIKNLENILKKDKRWINNGDNLYLKKIKKIYKDEKMNNHIFVPYLLKQKPVVKEVIKTVEKPVVKEVIKTVEKPVVKEVIKTVEIPVVKEVIKTVEIPVVKEVIKTVDNTPDLSKLKEQIDQMNQDLLNFPDPDPITPLSDIDVFATPSPENDPFITSFWFDDFIAPLNQFDLNQEKITDIQNRLNQFNLQQNIPLPQYDNVEKDKVYIALKRILDNKKNDLGLI